MAPKWWTLLVACVATFMLLLDVTVVNVALPDIRSELGGTFTDMQWVVDAYALGLATLLLASGSLGDLLGRRMIFAFGIGLFAIASFVCGLAGSPTVLNVARGVQGIGGAMMFATSLALIAQEFAPQERGTAFGLWGATTGFAVAVGPVIGGLITEHLGWEWIFFVNVPVGVVAIAMTLLRVPEGERDTSASIDWGGLVTFSGALFCLVLALIRGNAEGWGSALIVALLVASAALLLAFVAIELRGRQPMLDLQPVPHPGLHGRADHGLLAARVDVRDVPLPRDLHPEHPRLLAARGRPPLPPDLGAVVPRRPGRRQARRAAARARIPRRAAWCWWGSGWC